MRSVSSSEQPDISPLAEALASVGDRWTLLIVAALLDGPRRFGDLEKELQGIAPNVLSQRLRNLESQGLVRAERYSERPPRFVYELAASGRELAGALRLLADWGEFIDAGDKVVAILRMKTRGRGSGVEIDREDSLVYDFRDGKVVRLDYFNTREQGLAAAGVHV